MSNLKMRISFELSEEEMKEAVKAYIREKAGAVVTSVSFSYYDAGGDPRERSSYSARAS